MIVLRFSLVGIVLLLLNESNPNAVDKEKTKGYT